MENVKEETKAALNQVAAEARERGYDSSLSLSDYSDWANDFDVADMPDLAARVRELCDW